ncbi:mitogen-activated protein kinase kinase kinase 14-like [Hippocampus zosterae]|uniref:mitogen-activated protein kinase kinase kinase 14-like n=1 Tax=Hippocampus zosterae TaxID=109293 RepID=UPI00223CD866|nr:mitogen-activated protein kinase kinase kinase 14-like [Hippocampus zosterae]
MLDPRRGYDREWQRRVGPRPLGRAMLLGTAELLDDTGQPPVPSGEPLRLSVVAQAESEDLQEFSPTHVHRCDSRLGLVHASRKEAWQANSKSEQQEGVDVTSFPARGICWSRSANQVTMSPCDVITPPPQFKDWQHDGDGGSPQSTHRLTSSCQPHTSRNENDWSPQRVSGAFSSLLARRECGSASSPAAEVVSLCPSFTYGSTRHLLDWSTSAHGNQGFLLHRKLRPIAGRYREGREYDVLRHIHSGAYGDVVCVRDYATRFTCAAKKVPVSHFREEEVRSWSLATSSRVVRLFGAVREGPNMILFMDLKPAGLAQLLGANGGGDGLPRDLSLHYLHQTLGALQHLHSRNVLHLDVKVDNVLLSADLTKCFLCDFGLSRVLDENGRTTKDMGASFPGTESHMSPEVARGECPSGKADVWSSCCMLLHMLNGRHPWIRRYAQPLCLHIVTQPPPLWEVPSGCDRSTLKVFRAGLRKDPDRRATAAQLRGNTAVALAVVGGVSAASLEMARDKLKTSQTAPGSLSPAMRWVSPWRTAAALEDNSEDDDSLALDREGQPASLRDETAWDSDSGSGSDSDSDLDIYVGEEDGDYEGDCEDEDDEGEDEASTQYLRALMDVFPVLRRGQVAGDSDGEVQQPPGMLTPSPEPRDDPPSCFSSSSQVSQKDSECSSDDLSSGIFSSSGGHAESSAWARGPPLRRFEGVDIWIEDARGRRVRIRERRQVRVGHVAIGISEQMSTSPFTLETLDRKSVCFRQEICESCLWLRCVEAPDSCPRWMWRVRDGKLEVRQ